MEYFEDEAMAEEHESHPDERREYEVELWKKWTKAGGIGRFASVRPWLEAGKFTIDVGESDDSGLRGSTKVFANATQLITYLRAIRDGNATSLYPADERKKLPAESFVYYGGGQVAGKPISRVLKISYWLSGDTPDTSAFAWKCGHFVAQVTKTGAYQPDMKQPLSVNSIKLTRLDMAELATLLGLALVRHATTTRDNATWLKEITGKSRSRS